MPRPDLAGRYGRWLVTRPRAAGVLAAALGLALVAAAGLAGLGFDNSPRVFFVRDAQLVGALDELQERFGGGSTVRIAWGGDALWTAPGVAWLERATRRAAAVRGVVAVHGPLRLEPWWPPAEEPAELGRRLRGDPLALAGGWVTADGDFVSLLVELEPGLSRADLHAALAALERLAAEAPGAAAVMAGLPVIERAMDRSFERLVRWIFPAIAVVCALLLALACRDPLDAALPLVSVALTEAALVGCMGWAGARLNLVSSVLLPIVFVLGLVTATHLQMRFRARREEGLEPGAAAAAALRDRAWPVFWAGATTAAAFGSFVLGRLPAARQLGLWTAVGALLMVAGAFALQLPAMALLDGARRRRRDDFDRLAGRLGRGVATAAARRPGRTLAALGLAAVAAGAGVLRLELDSNLLGYFPAGHPLRVGFAAVAERGVGAAPADLLLELDGGPEAVADPAASFRDPERLRRLAELTAALRAEPPVLGALGAGDLFEAAGRRATPGGPSSARTRWLVLGLLQTDPEASRLLARMVTPDGRTARLTLLLPVTGHGSLLPALDAAAERARAAFPEARVRWTGEYPLVLVAQRDLLATMSASLALTVAVVAAVLALLAGSLAVWAAVAAANLWPLVVAVGAMGWGGVPLDSTTVMIAAVVLGTAVDDTFHTLGELRRTGGDVLEAIAGVAPAQLLTTTILALGMASCALSDFLPIARFGLVTAAALVAALAGDWLLLPALLRRRSGRREAARMATGGDS